MENFTFYNPTKIIMGRGENSKIGEELHLAGISRVLLLYGGESLKKTGVYKEILDSFEKHGIEFSEVGGVKPNPVLSKAHEAIDVARAFKAQAIVASGGGSVMDSAKAIAAGIVYDGDVWDFYEGKSKVTCALPIYGVITLSATASEMNFTSVITNEEKGLKLGLHSPHFFPKCSIIDPSVQFTVSEKQTVFGGIDVIAHILECYFDGTKEVEVQMEYAEGLLRTMLRLLPVLQKEPDNYNARAQVAWASVCGLNGTTNAGHASRGDFSSHAMGHPFSATYDSTHGATLAVIMPGWMRYVCESDLPAFCRFARNVMGVQKEGDSLEIALEGIDRLKQFFNKMGAPTTLLGLDIPEASLETMAKLTTRLGPVGRLKPLQTEDVLAIYKSVYR